MQVFAHFETFRMLRLIDGLAKSSGIRTAEGGHHRRSTSQHPLIFLSPTYFFPWFPSFQVLHISIVITIIIIGLQCISVEILLESNFPPVLTYLKVSEVGRHLPG